MASGTKSSMPEVIFVIYDSIEYRTYTTVLAFATAINDGYAHGAEVKVFVPADWADDRINVGVKKVAQTKPCKDLPTPSDFHSVMALSKSAHPGGHSHNGIAVYESDYSPVQKTYMNAWKRRQAAHRKKHKDQIKADLIAALGREF